MEKPERKSIGDAILPSYMGYHNKPLILIKQPSGGYKYLYFHPENWGNDPTFDEYFSDGLKPPTRDGF